MQKLHLRAKQLNRLFLHALLPILILTLAGCAKETRNDGVPEHSKRPAKEIIISAMENFNTGHYKTALKDFEEIMDIYPFSKEALLAELKAADSHYYMGEYPEAKIYYQQFEEQHPTNQAIAYVMFQTGMCDIKQTDRIDRNVTSARDAIHSFSRLLRAFPDSPYTKEARARKKAAQEFLANHELYVAVFYVKSKRYKEALHRLKYLLTMYPESAIVPKAQQLQKRLKAGDPPRLGINRWLPDLEMPDWHIFGNGKDKG